MFVFQFFYQLVKSLFCQTHLIAYKSYKRDAVIPWQTTPTWPLNKCMIQKYFQKFCLCPYIQKTMQAPTNHYLKKNAYKDIWHWKKKSKSII